MPDAPLGEDAFLKQIIEVIEMNLSEERFGVSELAREIGMSRSNLLRKIKKLTGSSVSRYIRQVRLEHAMDLLKENKLTVSEISYRVGFNSTSYFIKCFREHYGYPPGEAEKRDFNESDAQPPVSAHRLAAIMFTDIEGYTALMQQNEEKALHFRNRHREIFKSVTKKHQGKILQYYGDGTLSIFQSAIDAVKCGIDLQLGFRQFPEVPVRIGIHSGDVILKEEDIIGDGVNIASRVESLAVAGSVFISEKIYDEVKNQSAIQTASLGSFEFKNVDKPIQVYAVINPGLVIPEKNQLKGKLKEQPDRRRGVRQPWEKRNAIWVLIILAIAVGSVLYYGLTSTEKETPLFSSQDRPAEEKSIAVLPFINDSNDSTNVYIINGLMEAILNHLQKIENLRVISRTSVEKYRSRTKAIPEIAEELEVQYFVEGSGQKVGDQILLTIQLVEAQSDRHLLSKQYDRKVSDIFQLQREVAEQIADEIKVVITPEEQRRLAKTPTDNLPAYDAFLKGLDQFNKGDRQSLQQAIRHYEEAVDQDPEFALAYAGLAVSYFLLDRDQTQKQYSELINNYADKALLYDPELPYSMMAKALYYIHEGAYTSALPHLEKALEYHPNSAEVINLLAEFYTRYIPNTEKYLEYALRGIRLDIASKDSTTASLIYLHVSNAFAQSGFIEEAHRYIDRSLAYNPENLFSAYIKAFILYAKNQDLAQTKALLLETLSKDSGRPDILQEVAKICYFMHDFEQAYYYYDQFLAISQTLSLDIYPGENAKIAMVMRQTGRPEEAEKYIQLFENYTAGDQSIYKDLNQALLAAYRGDTRQAIQYMQQFSEVENFHYWILLFLETDPIMDDLKPLPAFQEIMRTIKNNFWKRHEQIRATLKEQKLIPVTI